MKLLIYSPFHTPLSIQTSLYQTHNMDKCWFVLRQTHYPPPLTPTAGTQARAAGAICLGHLIPDLKHLDQVINSSLGPEPYTATMRVYETSKWGLKWTIDSSSSTSASVKASVPTGVLPVDVNTCVGAAFKESVTNYWEFDRLDTAIVQPRRAYIDDSLEAEDVQRFLDSKKVLGMKFWTLYMISGIVIARGARIVSAEEKVNSGLHAAGGVKVPGAADIGASTETAVVRSTKESWKKATDFVWALRLTRISKGLFDGDDDWKMETTTKGATFSKGGGDAQEVSVEDELAAEGVDLDHDVTLYNDEEGGIFVVPNAGTEALTQK
ncbi:hypothetical protein BKA61DRAFT_607020 [Leptodontidium sp. MPI-SDFR-AT-0119]|nr:hypothetical protein BKA61DRAFT_607020 [Leptodontidium sp. MPI-SDFR-AT-0119]